MHCLTSRLSKKDVYKRQILIDDGLIGLRVEKVNAPEIVCTVVNGGELGEKKGVNVPNVSINLPNLTEKDKGDLLFGIEQDIDFVAASFIRNAEAINEIREFLVANGGERIDIIAKIENAEGVQNIDSIIDVYKRQSRRRRDDEMAVLCGKKQDQESAQKTLLSE